MNAELAIVPETGEIVRRQALDSWIDVVSDYIKLAEFVCETEFVPRGLRGNVPATTAAMLLGREAGLDVMTALGQVNVIEGKPGLSAEAMRALVLAAGHEIRIDKATSAECVIRGRRRGSEDWSQPVRWTLDDARAAGLDRRGPWRQYPRRMLIARASTDLCRDLFADVIHGMASTEELGDIGIEPAPEAPPAGRSTTRVARKRQRKTPEPTAAEQLPPAPASAAVPPSPPVPEPEPDMPPLPGEDELPPVAPPLAAEPEPEPLIAEDLPRQEPEPRHDDDPLPIEEEPPAEPPIEEGRVSRDGVTNIILHFGRMGLTEEERDERLMLTSRIIGREISTTNELTPDEAEYVIATLRVVKSLGDLRKILDVVEENAASPEEESP